LLKLKRSDVTYTYVKHQNYKHLSLRINTIHVQPYKVESTTKQLKPPNFPSKWKQNNNNI